MAFTESTESSIRLGQYWLIFKRRWLPASCVFVSVFTLAAIGLLSQKPSYVAQGKLLFKKEIGSLNPLQQNTPLDTEAKVVRSVPILQKTIDKLELKDKQGNRLKVEQFLKQIDVNNIKKTDVLEISYKDTNAKLAAAVVNNLMDAYLESNLLANRAKAVAARKFIQRQLPQAKASLREAQLELRQIEENNKVALNTEANSASELERQLKTAQATYSLLHQKFQEIRIAENQNLENARVISAATVPNEPVTTRQIPFMVAAVMGILASVASIYVLEATDKSIRSVEQARKVFGFTLLGVIPALKKSDKSLQNRDLEQSTPEIIVRESPNSPLSEAYQILQANLKFLNSDKELKAIVVTSSVPKEGKSSVSANLAVAMAQMGRKVLLVDANMRYPLQHKIWNLSNHLGLSNIIVGQTEPRKAIKKITANLHVLTAGLIPPNPIALLDSQRMVSLIEVFCAQYDYIVVDTPAVNTAADAAILGKMTDGVLLVVRPGVVDTASAARAKEFLEQSNQQILGQVINEFYPENRSYSYYHFLSKYGAQNSAATIENPSFLRTGKNT